MFQARIEWTHSSAPGSLKGLGRLHKLPQLQKWLWLFGSDPGFITSPSLLHAASNHTVKCFSRAVVGVARLRAFGVSFEDSRPVKGMH